MFAHVFGSMSSSLTACDDKAIKALCTQIGSAKQSPQFTDLVSCEFFCRKKTGKNARAWMDVIEAEKTLSNK